MSHPRRTLPLVTDAELLEQARMYGYELVDDGGMWRIRDVDAAFQPCSPDRAVVMHLLGLRVAHVRSDPNRVPWTVTAPPPTPGVPGQ